MSKKVKLSYILALVMFGITIAWNTLAGFFNGVGLNYVAMLGIISILIFWLVTEKEVRSRVLEIIIALATFLVLETICYFVFEFGLCSTYECARGFQIYQHVISVLAILCFAYTMVRFLLDFKGIKVHCFEVMLGNEKRVKKVKESKEISNGSLSAKPNRNKTEDVKEEETVEDSSEE